MRTFLFILLAFVLFSCTKNQAEGIIRVNQVGYYPKASKRAVVVNAQATDFELLDADSAVVFRGELGAAVVWDKSGERTQLADFSEFQVPGRYRIRVAGATVSHPFTIGEGVYGAAAKASIKTYYYARVSVPLLAEHAGVYTRAAGHPDTLCFFHPSALRGEGSMRSPGGWYDAGDYNKYIVNGGISVATLLHLYEDMPQAAPDGYSTIPESGNKVPDLLDEIRYELEWMFTMQAPEGGSHMKLTSKQFTNFDLPHTDTTERYVVGLATAPTLNLAAVMAQAARVFAPFDTAFAQRCRTSAERAWSWAVAHPKVAYTNPSDISTGEYGDTTMTEEFWWAASELFVTTQGEQYAQYLQNNTPVLSFAAGEGWSVFVGALGSFSLLRSAAPELAGLKGQLEKQLLALADSLVQRSAASPYRIPIDDFHWGSNSDFMNAGMVLAKAWSLSKAAKYAETLYDCTDYVLGKNATGYCFVTGFGSKSPQFPHNRYIAGDKIEAPIPGFLVGGPNAQRPDDISKASYGVSYPSVLPAMCYVDIEGSYASNETAINWNAPLSYVLAFLEQNKLN